MTGRRNNNFLFAEHQRQIRCRRDAFDQQPSGERPNVEIIITHGIPCHREGLLARAPLFYGIDPGVRGQKLVAHGLSTKQAALKGGYVLAAGGKILGQVPLPIAGLMSDAPWERVRDETAAILRKAYGMGIPSHVDPFTTLSFLALPVIPQLRLTDRGLFDVDRFCLL